MKNKTVNRLLSLLMIASMTVACATGCGDKETATKSADFGEVWSAPSTVKILQNDVDYADKGAAELHYNAVRNEQESQQLMITATKDVKDYDLKVSDLKSENATFSKDNFTVYQEKFIPVTEKQYFNNETTYVPDALLPMDAARKAGELTIQKGHNAGMWVRVDIPTDAEAGVYTGEFTLEVDGTKMDIPVSLTVNDYTLPENFSAATLFSWRYDRVAAGELDSSMEMMTYYYEWFLENGISLQSLPMEALTGEEMVAALDKYYDQITSFCILQEVGEVSGDILASRDDFNEQIFALAEASDPDRNLLSKAFIYTADEPDFTSQGIVEAFVLELGNVGKALEECAAVIENDTTGKFKAFKEIPNWKEYVEDMPLIVPLTAKGMGWIIENRGSEKAEQVLEVMNCICPVFRNFKDEWTDIMYELCEEYDMRMWWYGCSLPAAPASTYHIGDMNLLSARSISWLQRERDIEGNLYWDAAAYTTEDKDSYNQYVDVYTNPYRITGAPAGDGFLAYPGAPYGIYGPIPSMRLLALRDGMEEYELLKAIEEDYDQLAKKYGKNFDTDACMNYFYHILSDGQYFMTADGEGGLDFDSLRKELIQCATMIQDGVDFAFCGSEPMNNVVDITCFAAEGTKITANGVELTQEKDGSFAYQLNLTESTGIELEVVSADGKTYTFNRFIGMPILQLNALSDQAVLSDVTVSDGSSVELQNTKEYSTDGSALHFKVNGVVTGNELIDVAFIPSASINVAMFEGIEKISDLASLQMDVYNPGEAFEVTIRLYSGTAYVDAGTYTINAGKNEVVLGISNLNFSKLDETDRIAFEFVNSEDGKKPNKYQFYLDNIVGKN